MSDRLKIISSVAYFLLDNYCSHEETRLARLRDNVARETADELSLENLTNNTYIAFRLARASSAYPGILASLASRSAPLGVAAAGTPPPVDGRIPKS